MRILAFRVVRGIPGRVGCRADHRAGLLENEDDAFTFHLRQRAASPFRRVRE